MLQTLNRKNVPASSQYPVKVLQFGEGNFLRGFVDWIIDIMNEKTDFQGAVQIVQPIQQGMTTMINSQDGLYHVVLNGIRQGKSIRQTRLITALTTAVNPFEDLKSYLACGENPELQFVVSNTTEAGIIFCELDIEITVLPSTFPGKVTMLLYHRFKHFHGDKTKGLIFMPCELIEKNGENLKAAILQYIDHWKLSDDFKGWILQYNTFCNTLVDRIVPGFPKETINDINTGTGYEDKLVVMAEPFHLWVIEGTWEVEQVFAANEAGLEVKFVKDLTPYRTRKVRILNGAHTALVPVAYLKGHRTVRESIDDEVVGGYIRKAIFEEIVPTLDLPVEELHLFANDVIERFQNPFIRHELISISLNSLSKFKVRILPSILKYIEIRKQLPDRLLFSIAALIRFYKGEWRGEIIPLNDTPEVLSFLRQSWKAETPEKIVFTILSNVSFWDQDLTLIDGFAERVVSHLRRIETEENFHSLIFNLSLHSYFNVSAGLVIAALIA